MSRRRLTLATYVRRRWRYVGAIVVLLLGALLVLVVTDRGHDPVWEVTAAELDRAAIAPSGSATYALLKEDGLVTRIAAYRGADGALLWEGRLNATRALLAAGPSGAVVATDFPGAFLTVYGDDGSLRWQHPLEGNPVAVAFGDDDVVALALQAPRNPVLVFQGEHLIRTFHHGARVNALSMSQGLVAVAADNGDIVVRALDGREVTNVSLAFSPSSLRLADDGTAAIVGGTGTLRGDRGGHVAFLDVGQDGGVRWTQETPVRVGIVDLDAAGLRVVAVEESPPSATLWTRLLAGSVPRDDAGEQGAVAMSPDARHVAVGTVRGDVRVYDAATGEEVWRFRAAGANVLSYARDDPDRLLVGGRLLASRPFDSLMLFQAAEEPIAQRAGILGIAITGLGALSLVVIIGVGYLRARGTY